MSHNYLYYCPVIVASNNINNNVLESRVSKGLFTLHTSVPTPPITLYHKLVVSVVHLVD